MLNSRKVINTPTTGVYPPFDSDFARAWREKLDALTDEDLVKALRRMESETGVSTRESRVKLQLEQSRRRANRQAKAAVRFGETFGCGPEILQQIGQISKAEAEEIIKRFVEKWPQLKNLLNESNSSLDT